jgi:methionyl-tRNA formyltransferase
VPRLGILNVHASLLPRWRGAAPIPAAILAGDAQTGATIMRVVRALDAGPMLAHVSMPIGDEDTTATLTTRVAEAGASLLLDVLPKYAAGQITPVEQDDALATYAPQITASDARIDWRSESALQIWRKVRAYDPWPVAHTSVDGNLLRILDARPTSYSGAAAPGTVVARDDGFAVVCAEGALAVLSVQPAGRARMDAAAFLRGQRGLIGRQLDDGLS